MGFFSDLKEDLSQAVDELMPNEAGAAAGNHMMTQEEIMAAFAAAAEESAGQSAEKPAAEEAVAEPTSDISDISLEEMLKNIDSIAFPEAQESVAETAQTTETVAEDPGTPADAEGSMTADMDVVAEASGQDPASDSQSLEEMLAAAIAALPEQEESESHATEEPAVLETVDEPEEIVKTEEAEQPEMTVFEDPADIAPEQNEEEGVTIYESLVPEDVVSEELVIEEPVIDESPAVDSFHQELMADIPLFDETLKQKADAPVSEEAEEAPAGIVKPELTPAPELDIERTAKEMTYVADGTSVIAAGMHICGDLFAESPVSVMGTIEGNVEVNGKLSVGGQIHGNIHAAEVYAEGAKLTGDIVSESAVKLGAKSVVMGNILANSAAIAGAVKGDIDVHGPIILDSTAIVVGNIKFKSIQINNGAVIEGMCLQCYADINPTSFFDAV